MCAGAVAGAQMRKASLKPLLPAKSPGQVQQRLVLLKAIDDPLGDLRISGPRDDLTPVCGLTSRKVLRIDPDTLSAADISALQAARSDLPLIHR